MSNRKEVKEQSTRRTTDLSSRSPEKPVVGKDFAELKRKKQRQKIEISESAFKKKRKKSRGRETERRNQERRIIPNYHCTIVRKNKLASKPRTQEKERTKRMMYETYDKQEERIIKKKEVRPCKKREGGREYEAKNKRNKRTYLGY